MRADKVMDAMLTLTTTWAVAHEGPQVVARQLYMLALKFAAEAEGMKQGASYPVDKMERPTRQ
jgi:hypothetical protein